MNYRLVAVDVDGTLLNSKQQLSERTKIAIQQLVSKGVLLCISTGRPVQVVELFRKLLGIKDLSYILYNGAMLAVGEEHRIVYEQNLAAVDALALLMLGAELGATLIAWSKNCLYVSDGSITSASDEQKIVSEQTILTGTNRFTERINYYRKINSVEPQLITEPAALAAQGITKIIWFDEVERMPLLMEALRRHPVQEHIHSFPSNPRFLELVDKNCSKASALEQLIKYLKISREETIAIGDGWNDVPMLQYAGLGIAMGNAPDEIKALADEVTLSNDEDGVAVALSKHFGIKLL